MAKFADIIGQEQIKEHLQNALQQNKINHAYILNGDRNAGKEFIAKVLQRPYNAKGKICLPACREPCGQCHSCKQMAAETSRMLFMFPMKSREASGWRRYPQTDQCNGDVAIKPYSSPRKVYIIK